MKRPIENAVVRIYKRNASRLRLIQAQSTASNNMINKDTIIIGPLPGWYDFNRNYRGLERKKIRPAEETAGRSLGIYYLFALRGKILK